MELLERDENKEKLRTLGQIATGFRSFYRPLLIPGAKLADLLAKGTAYLEDALTKVYTKKKYERGIAFPLCISLNEQAGFYLPEKEEVSLKVGDLVKLEYALHLDNFPLKVGDTYYLSPEKPLEPVERLLSALTEAQATLPSLFNLKHSTKEVILALEKIAAKYSVNIVSGSPSNMHIPGMLSYQMSPGVIDGKNDDEDDENIHRFILQSMHGEIDFEFQDTPFEENELYGLDIAFSTGRGRVNETDIPCRIYKRDPDIFYALKINASRKALTEFCKHAKGAYPCSVLPFDSPRFRFGLRECLANKLLEKYPVLSDKEGQYIGRIQTTILVGKKKAKVYYGAEGASLRHTEA